MKPLSLNMSRYRKVAEDPEKSTLQQHDTGHTITIAHKALPREQRNYLKALPLYDADQADPEQEKAPPQAMAKGGKINASYGDAIEERGDKEQTGDDDPTDNVESNPNYKEQVAQALQDKYRKNVPRGTFSKDARGELTGAIKKRANYASGGSTDDLPNPTPSDGGSDAPPPVVVNVGAPQTPASPATPAPVVATPDQQGVASAQESDGGLDQAQSQLSQAAQDQTPEPSSPETSVQNAQVPKDISFTGGVGQQVKGQLQTAQALGTLGAQQAKIEEEAAAQRGILQKHFEDSMNQLNNERLANAQDVQSGQIDPSKYWDNHSKIATGLGLILAGFNPTNRPNAALEFLQNNIQRDTQAQMANLGSKQDLLAHTVQQFGNVRAGAEFANILKTDQIAHQLQAAAAKSQNAQQAGAFNTLAGQLLQQSSQRMIPLSAMQGAMSAMRNGTDPSPILPQLRVAAPEMAKTVEEHLFPSGTAGGGGTTDRPVTPEASASIAAQGNILDKTNRLKAYIDSLPPYGQWNYGQKGAGEALAVELQQAYQKGGHLSVAEPENKRIQEFITSKPGGVLSAYFNDPKLETLGTSMGDTISQIKHQFGFYPFNGPLNQQAPQATPTPQAAQSNIQMREGKPYKSMYSPKLKKNVLVPA